MLQTKFIYGVDLPDLQQNLNKVLSETHSDSINVQYFLEQKVAVVEYEIDEDYKNEICCDCAYWNASTNNLMGICQYCGQRKRFSDKACTGFVDVRA